ncbi:MAG: C40 family peptidase [Gammaproteobacteria bacterium]|nr:C40 family peptidase [Gammaproteobacteria bacterium]MCW8987634.1 C40 family peptidase [Gammaproteobacteria bacterium]MCW9032344.1 C40 family peptidase [Gammaproteobacteria bacterium]
MTINKLKIKIAGITGVIAFGLALSGCGSSPKYQQSNVPASKQAIIKTAKNMLGVKYRYGGANPNRGFDCSGLVQYSHKAAGIDLPRTTGQQYKASKRVPRKYLKAGDLVFFKTALSRLVSHVGIYLGNNKFIHAPSSGKRVKISSMKETYWRQRFTGAGRFL